MKMEISKIAQGMAQCAAVQTEVGCKVNIQFKGNET